MLLTSSGYPWEMCLHVLCARCSFLCARNHRGDSLQLVPADWRLCACWGHQEWPLLIWIMNRVLESCPQASQCQSLLLTSECATNESAVSQALLVWTITGLAVLLVLTGTSCSAVVGHGKAHKEAVEWWEPVTEHSCHKVLMMRGVPSCFLLQWPFAFVLGFACCFGLFGWFCFFCWFFVFFVSEGWGGDGFYDLGIAGARKKKIKSTGVQYWRASNTFQDWLF